MRTKAFHVGCKSYYCSVVPVGLCHFLLMSLTPVFNVFCRTNRDIKWKNKENKRIVSNRNILTPKIRNYSEHKYNHCS